MPLFLSEFCAVLTFVLELPFVVRVVELELFPTDSRQSPSLIVMILAMYI